MPNNRPHFSKRRTGAAAIEFALTVPFLFLFLFGSLEFARGYMILHSADNAAYEAARRGIVPGATVDDVQRQAQRIMGIVGARNVTVNVTPSTIDNATTEITVVVEIPMNANGYIAPLLFKDRTITSTMKMKREEFDQTNVS